MAKIFVRERSQVGQGAGRPRFVVVATLGTDLRIFAQHIRKAELEKLAQEAGAEIVFLPRGEHHGQKNGADQQEGHGHGDGGGAGHGHGRRDRHGSMEQE